MRKINLKPYTVKMGSVEQEYDVKENLIAVIFNRQLGLSGREIYERGKLADKIESCKDGYIILEEGEFEPIKQAFQKFKGFGYTDREMIRRIFECPKIEPEELQKIGKTKQKKPKNKK